MRWTLAFVFCLALAVAPADAVAGGTWASSDQVTLPIDWKTDDGSAVLYIRVELTQPVESAAVDGGANCNVVAGNPKAISCFVGNRAGAGVASGRVNAKVNPAVGCADSFQLFVSANGQTDTQQQPITSANQCGGGEPPPQPPGQPPAQTTGDVSSTQGAGATVSPPRFPIVTGVDAGAGPHVKVFAAGTLAESMSFFAFAPGFTGGVRVAVGDVNGDGRADVITGAGPGAGPHVKVFDGATGALLSSFFAYDPGFAGGVFVAAGDVNGDGRADVVTGAGGGAPAVKVFDGRTGGTLRSLLAYDAAFTGGVRVAAGVVNGDGRADIVTGAGPGAAGGQVKVFDGRTGGSLRSFFAYDTAFIGGVYVAAGDVNGDGAADVVTGAGPGAGPHVKVFSAGGSSQLASFFAYAAGFTGGVRVAAGDVNGDGRADVITGAGPGAGPHVKAFSAGGGSEVASFFAYDPGFQGGVFVASMSLQPVRLRAQTLTLGPGAAQARLPLACPAGASGACRGTVVLTIGSAGSPRAARITTLGRGKFSLRRGRRGNAVINLTRGARALLGRRRTLSVNAAVTTKDAGGNVTKTAAKLRLRAKRR